LVKTKKTTHLTVCKSAEVFGIVVVLNPKNSSKPNDGENKKEK
jgi:hypothetical protein